MRRHDLLAFVLLGFFVPVKIERRFVEFIDRIAVLRLFVRSVLCLDPELMLCEFDINCLRRHRAVARLAGYRDFLQRIRPLLLPKRAVPVGNVVGVCSPLLFLKLRRSLDLDVDLDHGIAALERHIRLARRSVSVRQACVASEFFLPVAFTVLEALSSGNGFRFPLHRYFCIMLIAIPADHAVCARRPCKPSLSFPSEFVQKHDTCGHALLTCIPGVGAVKADVLRGGQQCLAHVERRFPAGVGTAVAAFLVVVGYGKAPCVCSIRIQCLVAYLDSFLVRIADVCLDLQARLDLEDLLRYRIIPLAEVAFRIRTRHLEHLEDMASLDRLKVRARDDLASLLRIGVHQYRVLVGGYLEPGVGFMRAGVRRVVGALPDV